MADILTVGSGNWNAGYTWQGGSPPGIDDTAYISENHDVIVDDDVTVGRSVAGGTDAITIDEGGSLTIAPNVTLTVRGDITMYGNEDFTLEQGSTLSMDASQADPDVKYRIEIGTTDGHTCRFVANGTPTNRCTVESNAFGDYAYFLGTGSKCGRVECEYTDFNRIGGDLHEAIQWDAPRDTPTMQFKLSHCAFDGGGGILNTGLIEPTDNIILEYTTFTNTTGRSLYLKFYGTATTGIRRIRSVVCDSVAYVSGASGMTFDDCLFEDYLHTSAGDAVLRNTCIHHNATSQYCRVDYNWNRAYVVMNGHSAGVYITPNTSGQRALENIVIEPVAAKSRMFYLHATSADNHWLISNNIFLPIDGGTSGGPLIQCPESSDHLLSLTHNTAHQRLLYNESDSEGQIERVLDNIVWDSADNDGYKIYNPSPVAPNVVDPANCDYNAGFNLRAGSNGKGYDGDIFDTPPGVNDVEGVDPMFVDATRNMASWDLSLGGPGTMANALAELRKRNDSDWDPNYNISDLIDYVQAGFVPTNEAYIGTASDSGTIGAMSGEELSSSCTSVTMTSSTQSMSESSASSSTQSISTSSLSTSTQSMSVSSSSSSSSTQSESSSSTSAEMTSVTSSPSSGSSFSVSSSSSTVGQSTSSTSVSSSSSSSYSSQSASSVGYSSSSSSSSCSTVASVTSSSSSTVEQTTQSSSSSSSSSTLALQTSSSSSSAVLTSSSSSSSSGTDQAIGTRTISGKLTGTLKTTIKNVLDDGTPVDAAIDISLMNFSFKTGIGANQATRAWQNKTKTITSGSTVDIDLYDFASIDIGSGLGRDHVGQLLTVKQVVAIILKQLSGAGRLEVMPTQPANYCTWVPVMTVALGSALKSGGVVTLAHPQASSPLTIADASSHVLRLGANGGDVTYSLYVLARHYGV
jgi:hypothetical protein